LLDLDRGPVACAPGGAADRGWHPVGQLLVPARPAHPLRRCQTVRHRPRGWHLFAGVLYRAQQRLHQAVAQARRMDPVAEDILIFWFGTTELAGDIPKRDEW